MGVCNSLNEKPRQHKNVKVPQKGKGEAKDIKSPTQSTNQTNLKDEYLLTEKMAIRDDIAKYYKLSSEFLGQGASGTVCLGENSKGKFAIKRINKLSQEGQFNIYKEAEFNLAIQHPLIIKCYEIYEDLKTISFVMELAEGGDLFDFIVNSPQGKLPLEAGIDVTEQILEAVSYLHNEKGIVHRDLKPENFMVSIDKSSKPIIKLIDFGLATYIPKNKGEMLNDYVGTPSYAAPEIVRREEYDEKVDLWSIGIIVFNMLTGLEPFKGNSASELNDQIKYKKISFDLIEDESMRNLTKRMLERDPALRINSAEALVEIQSIKEMREQQYNKLTLKQKKAGEEDNTDLSNEDGDLNGDQMDNIMKNIGNRAGGMML